MFAPLLHRRHQRNQCVIAQPLHQPRFALGQRACLVDHDRRHLLQPLERFRILDEHARARAAPHAHHDRHRRRQPQRARARNNQHRHRVDERRGQARLGPQPKPQAESDRRHPQHHRHKDSGHAIRERLDRRAAPLRLRHHLHDARQHRRTAHLLRAHDEATGAIDRAPGHRIAHGLLHRHRLPGQHRFIHRRPALQDHAIHRHLLARPHAQARSRLHFRQRHLALSIVGQQAGRLRRQVEQQTQRIPRAPAGAQFEHLPEQHQHHDHRRRLEIDRRAIVMPEPVRHHSRRQQRHHAVAIRRAHPQRDEREHIHVPRDQRLHAAHEKGPARPQHHGRREKELHPARRRAHHPFRRRRQQMRHGEQEDRQRQRRADPKAARHVAQLAIVLFRPRRHELRLQRHAALRTRAGVVLLHLGVHRAGVERATARFVPAGFYSVSGAVLLCFRIRSAAVAHVKNGIEVHERHEAAEPQSPVFWTTDFTNFTDATDGNFFNPCHPRNPWLKIF